MIDIGRKLREGGRDGLTLANQFPGAFYHAILVEIDGYSKELSRYLHLNPVRAKIVQAPEEYPWSSYRDYIGMRHAPDWLYRDFILGCFDAKNMRA